MPSLPVSPGSVQAPRAARMTERRFEHCRVSVDPQHRRVATAFADGAQLTGCPSTDHESIARARGLGYRGGDEDAVWAMTQDHDLLHTVIAEAQGHPWSATLHAVAHGYSLAPGTVEQEERLVLFTQRLHNIGLERLLVSQP